MGIEQQNKDITYYAFGIELCRMFFNGKPIEDIIEFCKEDGGFSIFKFEEGITPSTELLSAFNGWGDYAIISKDEYDRLVNL